jgi:hypothetical protein
MNAKAGGYSSVGILVKICPTMTAIFEFQSTQKMKGTVKGLLMNSLGSVKCGHCSESPGECCDMFFK